MINIKNTWLTTLALTAVALILSPSLSRATSAETIDREVQQGLRRLYANNPGARTLGNRARAVLVFPRIVKAGFLFAGGYGEGALVIDGRIAGYYSTSSGSYGFQAGIEQYGYAMFFMTDSSLRYLNKSHGWSVGTGPSLVIGDSGFARTLTTDNLAADIYALIFNQQGLMAGIGLKGSKISRIYPD